MTRRRSIATLVVVVALAGGGFLLDRLGMKGLHWRIWAPAIAHTGDPIPEAALGGFVRIGGASAHQSFARNGTSYAYADGRSVSLLLRDGTASATRYVVRDVVTEQLSVRYPFGAPFHAEAARCGGEAVFADGAWTLHLASPECSGANGTWRHVPRVPESAEDDHACPQFHTCACDLAGRLPDIFAQTCEQTHSMIGGAPNDPASCLGGLALARTVAAQNGVTLPSSCEER